MSRSVSAPRLVALGSKALSVVAAASIGACSTAGDSGNDGGPADARPGPRLPPDAAPRPDAFAPIDANVPCVLPMTIDLDASGLGYLEYDHPRCDGGSGVTDDAIVAFEDDYDGSGAYIRAFPWEGGWELDAVNFQDLDCAMDDGYLWCLRSESLKDIPMRLSRGGALLDIVFRFNAPLGTVTIASTDYST